MDTMAWCDCGCPSEPQVQVLRKFQILIAPDNRSQNENPLCFE